MEEILDDHVRRGRKQFLVKWKGFLMEENEWLTEEDLTHADELARALLPTISYFVISSILIGYFKLPISWRFIQLSLHKATIGTQSPTIRSLNDKSELLRPELIRSCTTVLPQSCALTGSYTSDSSQCIPLVYPITTHFGSS